MTLIFATADFLVTDDIDEMDAVLLHREISDLRFEKKVQLLISVIFFQITFQNHYNGSLYIEFIRRCGFVICETFNFSKPGRPDLLICEKSGKMPFLIYSVVGQQTDR